MGTVMLWILREHCAGCFRRGDMEEKKSVVFVPTWVYASEVCWAGWCTHPFREGVLAWAAALIPG